MNSWHDAINSLNNVLTGADAEQRELDNKVAADILAVDIPSLPNSELLSLFKQATCLTSSITINNALIQRRDEIENEVFTRMENGS